MPLFVFAHFAHHLLTALPIPLLPMIRSNFDLDYTQAGFVVSAFTLAYGFSQIPSGWLSDRIGPRIMITISICGLGAAGLLIGLSQTYIMLIVFLALMGILGGGYHPASPPMISAAVGPTKRGQALGLHMVGGSASNFLSPLIAAAIAATWGWRGAFTGLAIPSIILGIIFFIILGRWEQTKKAEDKVVSYPIEAPSLPVRRRRLVTFLIFVTLIQAVLLSTIAFIPLFLVDHFGMSQEAAAASIALIYSAGFWAGPLGGYLSDRFGRITVLLATWLFAGPAIYLLNVVPPGLGISAVLALIGTTIFARSPIAQAYLVENTSERNRSTILGIFFFGGMEGSGILTPVTGYLIDRLGFYYSFTITSAILLIMTLIGSILLRGSRD
ncbi:MFS transporter [Chloroflexota bacterium]